MAWQTPITDRTELDVIARNEKGTYNATDLNRVGECVQILADVLNEYGYVVSVETKIDWQETDIPTESQMEIYLNNVNALTDAFYTLGDTPPLPESIQRLGWQGANSIERVLLDIKEVVLSLTQGLRYCGTFRAAEQTLPQVAQLEYGSAVCGLCECGAVRCGNYILRSEL